MSLMRKIILLLIVSLICSSLSSCYDSREIDELGFVIALGVDKGKSNILRLTFQIAKPGKSGGGEGGGEGGGDKGFSQITIEAPAIHTAINMLNTINSKQINISHIKAIVFSKELAQEGLNLYLHAIIRSREFRPNMNIVVARETAEAYLSSINPQLVLNPSKYYDLAFQSYEYTAFFSDVEFHDFYNAVDSFHQNPVAILAGISGYSSIEDITNDNSTYLEHGHDYPLGGDHYAGEIPQIGENKAEIMGLAVFDGDRMTGELDGTDSKYYLLCTGDYLHSNWTIPDPQSEGHFILMDIQQSRPRDCRVTAGEFPEIYLKLNLEGDFLAIQSGLPYEGEMLEQFETYLESFIKEEILAFLNKLSRDCKTDICGFGRFAKNNFLTWNEWADYQWKSKFKDAIFKVEVNFKARRSGLILKSNPSVSSEGEDE